MAFTEELGWDPARLRRERLAKLQKVMADSQIGAMLLTNPVSIRYATGVSVMPIWTSINLARYALIPVEGEPVIFEYGKALFRATEVWPSSKPARTWQYRFSQHDVLERRRAWADELKDHMRQWGVADGKLAIEVLDFHGHAALKEAGLHLCDADHPLEMARLIKTHDELVLLKQSCRVAEAAMYDFEKAIRPGISENELLAVFWGRMQELGGEHCSTRLIVAGEKTNPWFYEAGDNIVRPGDLVGIDTDMLGPEGYLCDISRTFICGDRANDEQREAYRVAYDFIQGTIELCRPGATYTDIVGKAPKYPDEYKAQAYSCMVHGTGGDDEPPFLPYPHERGALIPRGHLEAGMVLSVEFYAGKVGGRHGVKLEEQILITENGPELLSVYPFESRLLS